MNTNRLRLALERLEPSDWKRFESLCSAFLVSEFDDLRTVAAATDDGGRDSELFSPRSEPNTLFQYSVAVDWNAKVKQTVVRLQSTFPSTLVLVYLSNQAIGPAADALKRELRKQGISLDVRDRQWFIDRVSRSLATERAAEELAVIIVDPYLSTAGLPSPAASKLTTAEGIAALTFLGLQWQDDIRDKGLTRLAFEALVRAALSVTTNELRMTRAEVLEGVRRVLPEHDVAQVRGYVDSALRRLEKSAIRHWTKDDTFCLSHEEKLRAAEYKLNATLQEADLKTAIQAVVAAVLADFSLGSADVLEFSSCVRSATDAVLFERSQRFALEVQTGSLAGIAKEDISAGLLESLSKRTLPKIKGLDWPDALGRCVREVLLSGDSAVQTHMRMLADAYTLLAFLRVTPDVQGAVEKMFSRGQVWFDTSVLLPLFAEPLFEAPGRFTRMVEAADSAGLDLLVTDGVIEEIERHMNRALTCVQIGRGWQGPIPYLLERYIASGRPPSDFKNWLETFRGGSRPIDDIRDFLKEAFGIGLRSLEAERDAAPVGLRHALQGFWYEVHRQRRDRAGGVPIDELTITRLVEHDVECYCGITQLRTKERDSAFGYSAWWLTVDRRAFDLKEVLRSGMKSEPPDSPVLSADFLVNYLAFGPLRTRVGKAKEAHLPLLMELESTQYLTPELLEEAQKLREGLKDLPDRIIQRRVRDNLDRARRRLGPVAKAGMAMIDEAI